MKFGYGHNRPDKDCVAYIDTTGALIIRDRTGDTVSLCEASGLTNGIPFNLLEAIHKFYPGDKVTITF